MGRNVFVTGASGFLGRNLVDNLYRLYNGGQYYLLARSEKAEEAILSNIHTLDLGRVHIVRGDITEPYLGMGESEARELMGKIDDVWHLAAATSFNEADREQIIKSNVTGMKNLVEVCKGANLHRFNHCSTAYIAGRISGVISEDKMPELPKNGEAAFKNAYEESKYDGEVTLRQSGIPFAIYRPPILVGHSKTGDSQGENRMAYGYMGTILRAILKSEQYGTEQQFWERWNDLEGKSQKEYLNVQANLRGYNPSTKNFKCVDLCAESMIRLAENEESTGMTFNLVNPHNITCEEMLNSMQKALRIRGLRFAGDLTHVEADNPVEMYAMKMQKVFAPYTLNSDPEWDRENTVRMLGGYKQPPMTTQMFSTLMEKYIHNLAEQRMKQIGNAK